MSLPHQQNLRDSQNFLQNPQLVASLIDRSTIRATDTVYEIGPGKGIITRSLASRCRRLIAIEKDPALARMLRQQFAAQPNVAIHTGDFLHHDLPRDAYKVFSNIPFNITSALVARLTSAPNPPEDAYLVMQKEAADLYLGKPRESLRSILLKPWFNTEVIHHFQRGDFYPRPNVDVVLIRFAKRKPALVAHADRQRFRDFVSFSFTTWQPTLEKILKQVFSYKQFRRVCQALMIDAGSTPTALAFGQWLELFETLKALGNEQAWSMVYGGEQRLRQQQEKVQKVHRTRTRSDKG